MKQNTHYQSAGVWLDHDKAIILTHAPDAEPGEFTVHKTIDGTTHHGGGGGEHSMNNAKRADTLKYFKEVSHELLNYDDILIFGPGKSQEQFQHHLNEDAHFKAKQIAIEASEHITEPQMIAKVKEYFMGKVS